MWMVENALYWFVFMALLLGLNLYALRTHLRIVHLITIAVVLLSVPSMWSDFGGLEIIAFSMIMINTILPVMGMLR